MKRPSDQAKLIFLGLLRTVTALATDAAGKGGFSQTALFSASAAASSASAMPRRNLPQSHHPFQQAPAASSLVASTPITHTSTSKARRTSALSTTVPVQVRLAKLSDVPSVSDCNTQTLPENYNHLFYQHHIQEWPDLALVAVVENKNGSRNSGHSRPNRETNNGSTNSLQMNHKTWLQFGSSGVGTDTSFLSSCDADQNIASEDVTVVAYLLGKIQERSRDPAFRPSLSQSDSSVGVERFGHVSSLAVLPDYRRQGLAQLLLDQFHHHLIPQQCSFAGLHVRKSNTAAVQLYESLGYEPFSTIAAYYEDGEDAYYMKKILSSHLATQQSGPAAFSTSQSFLESLTSRLRPPVRLWESGPQELRLPRTIHVKLAQSTSAAAIEEKRQQQQPSAPPPQVQEQQRQWQHHQQIAIGSGSGELLTGTY